MWNVELDTFDAQTPVEHTAEVRSHTHGLNLGRQSRIHQCRGYAGSDSDASTRSRVPLRLEENSAIHWRDR